MIRQLVLHMMLSIHSSVRLVQESMFHERYLWTWSPLLSTRLEMGLTVSFFIQSSLSPARRMLLIILHGATILVIFFSYGLVQYTLTLFWGISFCDAY